jgi:DNA gyrase subunit B
MKKITPKKVGYSEENIERFAGLAGIRKKPTPYIGPTNSDGLWTIWREPADNAVDQALAGRNKMVHLIADSEANKYWVLDAGEGIPVGKKEFEDERGRKEKLSTLYVVTGLTHGGANFSGETISRGTHGIGIKATNAMSTFFKVWTFRDSAWWAIEYKSGKMTKDVHKSPPPKLPHGLKVAKGTVVCFTPELPMFTKGAKMMTKDVRGWCELTSYLVPGLEVKYTAADGKTRTLVHKRGPIEYIEKQVEALKATVTGKPFIFSSKEADIAVAFTDAEGEQVTAYTNGLLNKEGGEHTKAMYDSLVKSLKPYKGKLEYTPQDVREGIIGLVNYKISAPQFNNQPKDKLIDERVAPVANVQFLEAWTEFWKKNPTMAKTISVRASELRKTTNDFLKDKQLIKGVAKAGKAVIAKLGHIARGSKIPVSERELYIVEGDSAGGTAKRARLKDRQAVWPIRGKIPNVTRAAKAAVSNNAEIAGIFAALGVNLSAKDPLAKLNYGRVINMADPDVDGSHINTLLVNLFWTYTPDLIKRGMVFALIAPEYLCRWKGKTFFGIDKEDLYKNAGSRSVVAQHIKGWGEINDADLREAGMDLTKRRMYRITPPDSKGSKNFGLLMADDSAYRKQLLGIKL